MRIELHTQLHSGIYASHGGGEDVIVKTFKASPRGYTLALKALKEERESNRVAYGDIGRGSSWLELDGDRLETDPQGWTEQERWNDRYPLPAAAHYAPTVTVADLHNPYAGWGE